MAVWAIFGTHVGFESNQSTNILSKFRRSAQHGMLLMGVTWQWKYSGYPGISSMLVQKCTSGTFVHT
jgi:hypothetical protein